MTFLTQTRWSILLLRTVHVFGLFAILAPALSPAQAISIKSPSSETAYSSDRLQCGHEHHSGLSRSLLAILRRRLNKKNSASLRSQARIDPCIYKMVTNEYSSTYPQGVAVSSDGVHILLRTLSEGLTYGLEVIELPSKRVIASFLAADGDIARPVWSPDGTKIAFFLLRTGDTRRNLYVWDYATASPQVVPNLHSYAAAQVGWSPDSKFVAYSDPEEGEVAVNIRTSEAIILTREEPLLFEWAPDSLSLLAYLPSKPSSLVRLFLNGQDSQTFKLNSDEVGRGIAWNSNSSQLLLRTNANTSAGRRSRLSLFSLESGIERTIYESTSDIRNPEWVSDGSGVVFPIPNSWGRDIYYLKLGETKPIQVVHLPGWSDFWGNFPSSGVIQYDRQSDGTPELRALSLASLEDHVIYKDPDGILGSSPGIRVQDGSKGGKQLTGVLWKPQGTIRGLVVELHNMSGTETLTFGAYDAEYRKKALIANSFGFAYLYVDCYSDNLVKKESSSTPSDYPQRLGALVESLQKSMNISPKKTILLSYSVGAAAALSCIAAVPERYGFVTLVGISDQKTTGFSKILPKNQIKLIVVEATLDAEGTPDGILNEKSDLEQIGFNSRNIQTLTVEDVHLLIHPKSWIMIQAVMYSAF